MLTTIIAEYLFTEYSAYTSILNSCWMALDGGVWNSGCKSIISSDYICISQIFLFVSFSTDALRKSFNLGNDLH